MISKKIIIQGEEFLIDGKHLGSGTQGSVFQILHIGSGIVYAVKIVKVQDSSAMQAIKHETNMLKNIRSPYVISILPYSIVSENNCYMVMDYCSGGDLKEHYKRLLLSKIPIDEKRVKKLIHDCAQGYKTLEANKILHMDIKMENILVKKGKYALADFGLAINKDNRPKQAGGTLLYFSYARFTKKANQINSSDDMFAFGIVVSEFTNKLYHPYYTAKMFAQNSQSKMSTMEFLWRNLKDAQPLISSTYSEPLRDLILKMIAKHEKDRLTWQQLYKYVDQSPIFAETREDADLTQVKIVMPQIFNSGSLVSLKDIRVSTVNANLLNSDYNMQQSKEVQKIYEGIKEYIQCRLKICSFLARLIDLIEIYNLKTKSRSFHKIQETILSVMEQLVELQSLKELDLPEMESPPERIQIQIDRIRTEFEKILGVKSKVNCFRNHLKIQKFFNTIMSSIESEVHQFENNAEVVLKQIEIVSGIKQIKQDFSLNSALFKLILYLIECTKIILNEKNPRKQTQLIPDLSHLNLCCKDYGDKLLHKAVSDYIQNEGFIITFVEVNGCHEILSDSDEEPELVQLNSLGKYPSLY